MSRFEQTGKQRKDRPLAALNRAVLEKIAQCPSSSAAFLTSNGRGMRQSFVQDITKVMTVLVNEMCLRSAKIGVATRDGFVLRSWGFIAKQCNLPEWRVKQCVKFIFLKGWVTSKQPRESYTGSDNIEKWRGLASIKRVTDKYFKDLGIFEQFQKAKEAAKDWLKLYARRLGRPIKYIQTPVTLLRRRRKEAVEKALPDAPIPI
ncbi:hypothetical protein NMS10_002365 [Vibrio cholerae]|uniref:hypothetical protein n=1 Tax=Vibrio cholerae TaxID=666 RepID=UPI00115819EE|nr:hypothetical protein [Vibrio cholerae]EGR2083372.1 hypothetical protein [Vibrio cholerae]EJL6415931.1 hypothetical protein [Vibrio cholerae]EJL6451731.1 hypothetical protein [Vibrio cholerae]MCX9489764.1 hypothetical protein [Vibrio cholerae]MCX9521893.1 hypothetical protein [Vibrio cholerae]